MVTGYPLRFENVLRTVNEVWEMVCFEAGSRNNCPSAQMECHSAPEEEEIRGEG